jgi:transcriptional regulator with XRE-family HTH domain
VRICEAFKQTLSHFNLSQRQIAVEAGFREQALSRWLSGKQQINDDTLENLIAALPNSARQYFFLNHMIGSMDEAAFGELLLVISQKMQDMAQEKLSA